MSTFVYADARTKFDSHVYIWPNLAIGAALVADNYTANPAHLTLADIPSNAFVSRDVPLTHLSMSGPVTRGVIPTYQAFLSGKTVFALVLYIIGLTDAASPLLYYSSDGVGFPFLPQGFDYSVMYDQGPGGFFEVY